MDELTGLSGYQHHFRKEALFKDQARDTASRSSFADMLENSVQQVDELQRKADDSFQKLLSGEEDDLHSVMIRMNEADLATRFALEVRNKLLEAFQELQRMPV